jgi:phenylalanyl-tRNA synthetase alpha chain
MENQALDEIQAADTVEDLEMVSVRYLGRKGILTAFLRGISSLPEDQRPDAGKKANQL